MMSIKVSSIEWLVKVVKHEAGELGDTMLTNVSDNLLSKCKIV